MIKIEVDDKAVRRALDDLSRRLDDITPAMHAIGQALAEGSRERILSGRDWTGTPFAPNSPVTLARKKGEKPLIDSKSFVTTRLHYEAGRDSVAVGSSAAQAAVLQFGAKKGAFGKTKRGASIPWGDIPARRYLPVTQDGQLDAAARSLILDTLTDYLAEAL
ncbi:phage virion morphogenesis protein [Hydrogenophilus thermoluteolus]|uniref:Virion morphogenesis protein n=1 Tax=Hydrogenophilus thermoluteolus TaxID=297 RepID=A0A2Z6DXW8_HYDTE|nr:phage virion morphogenesis protein [Hydrogenophilus thermoluteolus]BBD77232.1 virion morphogenesis protein [Hydrogenophilus thermoluteolus]